MLWNPSFLLNMFPLILALSLFTSAVRYHLALASRIQRPWSEAVSFNSTFSVTWMPFILAVVTFLLDFWKTEHHFVYQYISPILSGCSLIEICGVIFHAMKTCCLQSSCLGQYRTSWLDQAKEDNDNCCRDLYVEDTKSFLILLLLFILQLLCRMCVLQVRNSPDTRGWHGNIKRKLWFSLQCTCLIHFVGQLACQGFYLVELLILGAKRAGKNILRRIWVSSYFCSITTDLIHEGSTLKYVVRRNRSVVKCKLHRPFLTFL